MRRSFIVTIILLCGFICPTFAQQQQELLRSTSPFYFEEFKDAKVLQPFGRFIKTKGNIFYKDGSFLYMENGKAMRADTKNILGVVIDSVEFKKVDDVQMGRVVAQQGYNYLLCVRTVDMKKYSAQVNGEENHPYLDMNEMGLFLEIDGESQTREYDKGFPLQDKYYFSIKGEIIPANESKFKKFVKPEMKEAFKRLMNDHLWSWKDPASLTQLFVFLPK